MKTKNPLYVVKGKEVQEASSIFDLVIKKFNLEPAFNILKSLFYLLLEQVENMAMFSVVKAFIDETIKKLVGMVQGLGLSTRV